MNKIPTIFLFLIFVFGLLGFQNTFATNIGLIYPSDTQYNDINSNVTSRPNYLSGVIDTAFGTEITRITDSVVFGQSNVRHHYSKDQPWNSDQTLIKINDGRILDGKSYQYLRTIDMPSEAVWSSKDPNKLFGISGNQFVSVNVTTGVTTILHTFTGYTNIYMGPWEGNISNDDNTVVFISSASTGGDIIVYDILNDTIVSSASISSLGYTGMIDWASISQSGNYVVINGRGSSDDSVKSFDRNLNFVSKLFDVGEHGDIGYDTNGNEVFVKVCPYQMARLDNGQVTNLPITNCGHLSTRNYNRPGWGYSTSNDTYGGVVAIKLDSSGIVEHFTQHNTSKTSYESESQGVPNPDGTKVMYASDWHATTEINSYIVNMPTSTGTTSTGTTNTGTTSTGTTNTGTTSTGTTNTGTTSTGTTSTGTTSTGIIISGPSGSGRITRSNKNNITSIIINPLKTIKLTDKEKATLYKSTIISTSKIIEDYKNGEILVNKISKIFLKYKSNNNTSIQKLENLLKQKITLLNQKSTLTKNDKKILNLYNNIYYRTVLLLDSEMK